MSDPARYDTWLADGGPAALVLREHLAPVEGDDGVFFPATYAAGEDSRKFPGGYNLDEWEEGGKKRNACLIDSVGSQANRIEPLFGRDPLKTLVPQINIKAGERTVSLLEAGHRAGDAIVRCSPLQAKLREAFQAVLKGNAEPLARVAPTSLLFGVWDSRDTQARLPRLFASTIRAFDVATLTRSAQFNPALDYIGCQMLEDPGNDSSLKKLHSERGFTHVPSSRTHGGIRLLAGGSIRRDATLSLSALRLLAVRDGAGGPVKPGPTTVLRRYILGLGLVAFTARQESYLRQGCMLVPDTGRPREVSLVHSDGKREPLQLTHEQALAYASEAASAFGVGEGAEVEFDRVRAEKDIKGEGDTKPKRGAKKKGDTATE